MRNINWRENQSKLRDTIDKLCIELLLVHSDSRRSLSFINLQSNAIENIYSHLIFLKSLARIVIFPSFNYDFPHLKVFDINNNPSQVGVISEIYRKEFDCERTFDPIFSFVSDKFHNKLTKKKEYVETFSEDGIFNVLSKKGSAILFYGASLSSVTMIHYVESLMKIPYRYYKNISGVSILDNKESELIYKSHFRPKDYYLDYDWLKIISDLEINQILIQVNKNCFILRADVLVNFWTNLLSDNLLYFLDSKSLDWVLPKLDKLGRGFCVEDFEN